MSAANNKLNRCPQCSAQMQWNPTRGKLVCEYCGYSEKIEPKSVEQNASASTGLEETLNGNLIKEHDLSALFQREALHKPKGYGIPVKVINCSNCGASIHIEPHIKATECSFCGSSTIIEGNAEDSSGIAPESLIPFVIDKNAANAQYKNWIKKGFFQPGDLKKRAMKTELKGIYLPFWTFDATVYAKWKAEAGHYYYTDESYYVTQGGKRERRTRRVRKIRWESVSGKRKDFYDDVLVPGSTGVNVSYLEQIYPFDTKKLVPYDSRYLSGWAAENCRIDILHAWDNAQEKINAMEYERCARDIKGDTYRNLQIDSVISNVTFKLTLLPVWISSYMYKGKTFQFLINGQTGKIAGKKPISVAKVVMTVMLALIILGLLALFFHHIYT